MLAPWRSVRLSAEPRENPEAFTSPPAYPDAAGPLRRAGSRDDAPKSPAALGPLRAHPRGHVRPARDQIGPPPSTLRLGFSPLDTSARLRLRLRTAPTAVRLRPPAPRSPACRSDQSRSPASIRRVPRDSDAENAGHLRQRADRPQP